MSAWSFHSQIFFLSRRLHDDACPLIRHPTSVLQIERYHEDAEIFAQNLYRRGFISERDWASYWDLYRSVSLLLPPPNLVVYLQASVGTLISRINQRGRDFERTISADYLAQLNSLYDEWVSTFNLCPVLTIATDDLDFVQYPQHLDIITSRIEDRLRGKEVAEIAAPPSHKTVSLMPTAQPDPAYTREAIQRRLNTLIIGKEIEVRSQVGLD